MSGGVDSAVAAKLLKDQGHNVIGIFMRNWDAAINNDKLGNPNQNAIVCPAEADWADVKKIAQQLGIKVHRIDFVNEYWDEVFANLISNYQKGFTPNPDVLCNRVIKFGHFYDYVFQKYPDADYIAMGHYANFQNGMLQKPVDRNKDQTYFLAQVKISRLKKTLFPLATLKKTLVRQIALDHNLVVAKKRDSTGICFVGKRHFTQFLQNYIPAQPGIIIDIGTNRQVGTHIGAMYYTIGQRKGLNLGGMKEPYYVVGHNLAKRIVYVAPQSDRSYLLSTSALITDLNWLVDFQTNFKNLSVKFRYRTEAVSCIIQWLNKNKLKVFYPDGFESVTPGQQAVFYDGNICLGGGIIKKVYDQEGAKEYV